jgi:tRNA(fMet)-specific endonuclease VapC
VGLILDTNALSAIAEGERKAVKEFVRADEVAIPVIVLGEYRFGVSHSRHKHEYERWLAELVVVCRVFEVDERTTVSYAALRSELKKAGTPIPSNDVWIAALCRQHAVPILSRDRHFDLASGIRRVAW